MPRRTKEAPGRVTPRGGTRAPAGATSSGRYTAPLPVEYRHSPWWVPAIMLALFSLGVVMIVLNYVSLLPSSPSNWYLLGGLGLIVCGFAVSTQYR